MALPVDRCSCARIPLASLGALAALRAREDVTVARDGEHAWVHWSAGDEAVLRAVFAMPGAELYREHEGTFLRLGSRLPTSGVLAGAELLRDLIPAPAVTAAPPPAAALAPAALRLVPSSEPRPTTAALVDFAALARWAEKATSAQLASLRAARSGSLVVLVGASIPALESSERFSGESVFVPLGTALEPALAVADVRAVTGARAGELIFLRRDAEQPGAVSVDLVPEAALRELSRSSVRLAARGGAR